MAAETKRSTPDPVSKRRRVELLANTPYTVKSKTAEGVVLANGKALELWVRAVVPKKGYAILIDGLEYEFGSNLIG